VWRVYREYLDPHGGVTTIMLTNRRKTIVKEKPVEKTTQPSKSRVGKG